MLGLAHSSKARFPVAISACLVTAAAAAALVPTPAGWVERVYSGGYYLAWQRLVTPLSNLAPFALFDLTLFLGAGLLVTWWTIRFRAAPVGTRLRTLGRLTVTTAAGAAALYLLFLASWGCNYRRLPLRTKLDFEPDRVTTEANRALAETAVHELNTLSRETVPDAGRDLPARLAPAFAAAQRQLALPGTVVPGVPKRTLLSIYFRLAAIDGMTNPFLLEILINDEVLAVERPFVMAHEWAHLAGFAEESEASFVAWLICQNAGVEAKYSAWLFLYPYLLRSMAEDQRAEIHELLDPGPREDLRAIAERLRRAAPRVRRAANAVYDRFLKANRVEAGIASYDEIVTLILGTRFSESWTPAPRLQLGK